ncbi:MAG: hypothetical protein AB1757_23485 [Acidobacteriota bacterium]
MMKQKIHLTRFLARHTYNRRFILSIAVVALFLFCNRPYPTRVLASAPGDLDQGFGSGGIAVTYVANQDLLAQTVAIQPDGKIVIAGFIDTSDMTSPSTLVLARYLANGSPDLDFGNNGIVIDEHFIAFGIAIQPDGKLVLAGLSNAMGAVSHFALARFNSDGSIDSGFGSDGKSLIDFGGVPLGEATGSAFTALLLANGKIVAGGTISKPDGNEAIGLARFNADGSLDTSFGTNGKTATDFSYINAAARAFRLQADEKIIVSGAVGSNPVLWQDFYQPDDPSMDFALARFNADGSLDTTFGNSGLVVTDFFGNVDGAFAADILPSGKIVAAGTALRNSDRDSADFALIRYNPDGSLDNSFGINGKATADFAYRADLAYALLLQPDGKAIALGSARVSLFTKYFAVARFNPNGSLDTGFGAGGKTTTTYYSGYPSAAFGATFNPDGNIIATGYCTDRDYTDAFMLACYTRGAIEGDFSMLADTTQQTVTAGSSANFNVNVAALTNPPATAVNLSATISPPGVGITTSFTPASIGAGASSTLMVNTTTDTPPGDYVITIKGIEGEMVKTVNVTLTIVPGIDFSLAFDSPTVTGVRGTKVKIRVNINRTGGFSGNVTVTPPDLVAEGIVPKFPEPITGTDPTVAWKFKIKGWAELGPHSLTFTGKDESGRTRTATVTLMVE